MRRTNRSLFLLTILVCLGAAATAGSALGAVRSSHSGWFWGNPVPQGQTLDAVGFSGQTGYAAGEFGTLLKSVDAGNTWTGISTGLTEPLAHLDLLGPNSFVVGGNCALRRSDDGGKTFRRLPWTASDAECTGGIQDVQFSSSSTGLLLLGNGNVLRSTDAGHTWSRRTAVPGTAATSVGSRVSPTALAATSDTTAFAATDGGTVFSTVDAGNTWKTSLDEPWPVRTVVFPTPQVGYAAGAAPVVLKTTDGGVTWNEEPLPSDAPELAKLSCTGPDDCEGVSAGGDRIVRTTDGGANWDSSAPSSLSLDAVALPSATQSVAVGQAGTTVISNDAGATFTPLGGFAIFGSLTGIQAVNDTVAYAYGRGGALAQTLDGGHTWTEDDAATSNDLASISFLSKSTGFVLDQSGQLLRTQNGGDSYEILNTGTAQVPETVLALDHRHVLLVGPAGVRRSDDGGSTFKPNVQKAVRQTPLFDDDHAGSTVIAYGPKAILRSTDDGVHFTPLRRPSTHVRIDTVDLVSRNTLFLLSAAGPLYRTDDGGRHWRELTGLGTEVGYDMHFSDAKHGWVAVTEFGEDGGGWVMRTDDGGRTFTPQLVADSQVTSAGLATPSSRIGFVLTQDNSLFATAARGFSGKPSSLRISSPTRRIRKRGNAVKIAGRLKGASGGEQIVVSFRQKGSHDWLYQTVTAASNGTFTVVARLNASARFVAQWAGDAALRGAATPSLFIGGPPRR